MWVFDGETWTEDGAGKDQRDERPQETGPLLELEIAENRPGMTFVEGLPWHDRARVGRAGH